MKEEKHKVHPVAAGMAGVAIGAAAGATIAALADPKNRQRAKRQTEQLANQAKKTWQQLEPELRQAGHKLKNNLQTTQSKTQDTIEDLAVKGGEVSHQSQDQITEQYKEVKD
jgi:gas vesicle protein